MPPLLPAPLLLLLPIYFWPGYLIVIVETLDQTVDLLLM